LGFFHLEGSKGAHVDSENEYDATEMRKYLGLGERGPLEPALLETSLPLTWSRCNASILPVGAFLTYSIFTFPYWFKEPTLLTLSVSISLTSLMLLSNVTCGS
jgi:hypothetical protein